MSKVIIFSRNYPAYHPRKGEPTFFVEKIYQSLFSENYSPFNIPINQNLDIEPNKYEPKGHTIRKGKRWKKGDKFSPRFWEGKPYRSKQIEFTRDIFLVKVFDIQMCIPDTLIVINGINYSHTFYSTIEKLAKNDGLTANDFIEWFGYKPFDGQILCWDSTIVY